MKKLQFSADQQRLIQQYSGSAVCNIQNYVVDLLSQQLQQQGFSIQTLTAADRLEVFVEQNKLSFQIQCVPSHEGRMHCQISILNAKDQHWFERITAQSTLRQLKYAIENSLKQQSAFSTFEWTH